MCQAAPAPATFWDWIASIAPINFLPGTRRWWTISRRSRTRSAARSSTAGSALAERAIPAVFRRDHELEQDRLAGPRNSPRTTPRSSSGRYTHKAFWQEPHLIDATIRCSGMAQHYLLCPTNHGVKTLERPDPRDCRSYGIDGIVFHSTRTCRASPTRSMIVAQTAQREYGIQTMFFEGDVADTSFYKDEILEQPAGGHARRRSTSAAIAAGEPATGARRETRCESLRMGIDLGSTTAKTVILDDAGGDRRRRISRTWARSAATV